MALALKVAFRVDGRFEVAGSAHTAAAGLKLPVNDVDAVLLDLHLPDMAGPTLVHAFRTRDPDMPLILHSAADETPEVGAVRHLVDAVVPKSHVDELLAVLARLYRRMTRRFTPAASAAHGAEQLEAVFMHAPSGVALVAADGTFLRVNPALERMLGRSADELLQLRWQDLVHPRDLRSGQAAAVRAARGRASTRCSASATRTGGSSSCARPATGRPPGRASRPRSPSTTRTSRSSWRRPAALRCSRPSRRACPTRSSSSTTSAGSCSSTRRPSGSTASSGRR